MATAAEINIKNYTNYKREFLYTEQIILWIRRFIPLAKKYTSFDNFNKRELRELRSQLESELELLNHKIIFCYSNDKQIMDIIENWLEKIKINEDINNYYDDLYTYYQNVKQNNQLVQSNPLRIHFETSNFCYSLYEYIFHFEQHKCTTTNVIIHYIAETKALIFKITRLLSKIA